MRAKLPVLRRTLPVLAALLLAVTVGPGGPTAAALEPRSAAPAAPAIPLAPVSPDLPGLPVLDARLREVAVDSAAFREAERRYEEVAAAHRGRQGERAGLDRSASELEAKAGALEVRIAAARARVRGLRSRLDAVEGAINELATRMFVSGGSNARLDAAVTEEQPSINDHDRRAVLGTLSMDVLLAERASYRARVHDAQSRLTEARHELESVRAELARARAARPGAQAREVAAAAAVAAERVAYEEARALATVDEVDFPLVALDAYQRAARTLGAERPGCRLRWWGLAGISRVEGRHGSYGGAELDVHGNPSQPIIGIQLNGTDQTAVVPDSDHGALDGDPAFDRAVGPMQFIPQTWARFAADGNGDGTATPFNLYDATLAAGRYLCTASVGLDTDPGLRIAYFSYNHSPTYVDAVLGHARSYQARVALPDQPA